LYQIIDGKYLKAYYGPKFQEDLQYEHYIGNLIQVIRNTRIKVGCRFVQRVETHTYYLASALDLAVENRSQKSH